MTELEANHMRKSIEHMDLAIERNREEIARIRHLYGHGQGISIRAWLTLLIGAIVATAAIVGTLFQIFAR